MTDKDFPAFPRQHDKEGHNGMTLRDYFAAKAMQAYSSDADWRMDMDPTHTAYAAYIQADEMLKARNK